MKQKKFPMFSEAAEARTPSHLILQILIFLAVFIVIYIPQAVAVAVFALPAMFSAMDKAGVFDNPGSYSFTEMYDIAVSVSTDNSVLIPTLYSTVFGIILSLVYCRFIEKRSLGSMGMRKKNALPHYFGGLLCGILLMGAVTGISLLTGINDIRIEENISVGIIIAYFTGFFIQGASEEFIFRGYLMNSVGGKHSPFTAVAVSALAFAVAHMANPGLTVVAFINLILFGVFASVYMLRFDNIWGVCAIHSVWNFTQGNIFGISVSGTGSTPSVFRTTAVSDAAWLTGGAFGIEGSIITTAVLLTATAAVLISMKKQNRGEV